jgi:hypothetical protein
VISRGFISQRANDEGLPAQTIERDYVLANVCADAGEFRSRAFRNPIPNISPRDRSRCVRAGLCHWWSSGPRRFVAGIADSGMIR